ncbi:ABC transporter ATP-binding protein [Neisseria wadsworthii]|uniref:Iron (Fe3+) ABC superfamily ATP binding cassette transporter, ABC protein n=1 Tax=Neisseria wadsworthii 9715 TaxID=1030841 RepID=G4CPY3_9NEIS|nr:ABC transporter ATP-binding protein [Neisseria wadsworthii]EGZ47298.1 iron (Fe3+) ABC superfamily ATP binding cassette transporter, ABC protein [Neisseria wadsworthii 9715]QMT34918.1 ABC transporter ATP-binding protein [Neisseria wadsworthii]
MILEVSQLNLSFDQKPVLQDFGFALQEGEIACLLGHSGCGKTTVLRSVAGFEQPDSGTIILRGRTLSDRHSFMPPHLRKVGMVFQDYALFPHLSVKDNIAFGIAKQPAVERKKRIESLLELIGMPEYSSRYPHQLSGGQQQRVALARALAPKPELILLDEPFSNLDSTLRMRLSKEVRRLLKQENTSALMVTHDRHEAFAMADKIGIMAEGRLKQWDTPRNLYRNPVDAEVARFTGKGALLGGTIERGAVKTAAGVLPLMPENGVESSMVQVFVRPQNVLVGVEGGAVAEVIEQDFQGRCLILTLKLESGETMLAETSAECNLDVGSRVGIRLAVEKLAVFA